MNHIKTLEQLISILEQNLDYGNLECKTVSSKPIYWHLDHSLKVIKGISLNLLNSNPTEYQREFNLKRLLIFSVGKIPRGKGQAPKAVIPKDVISIEEIEERINKCKQIICQLNGINKHCFFRHPYFGNLSLKKAQYFMVLHTQHHLKIVSDIVKKQP